MELTGKLLAAMPGMQDPRFARALILVCSHSDDGAMGIIVNRPLPDMPFAALLEKVGIENAPANRQRGDIKRKDITVHYGGPVEAGRGFILHRDGYVTDGAVLDIAGGFKMSATLDVLESLASGAGPTPALLAMGYAGWGPHQLEDEIAENAWLTLDGLPDIVFAPNADEKWAQALRKSGVNPVTLSGAAGHA